MQATVMAAAATRLSCSDVVIRAGKREVVSQFSWQANPGGIAWLVGANGSGKSSLLRVLAGWQKPSRGRVEWTTLSGKMINYFTPAMAAPPELHVEDFLEFTEVLHVRHTMEVELPSVYPASVDPLSRFRSLSTGEAKRLLLWSILRQGTGPLVLDEPYEHLSRDAKDALTLLLRRHAEQSVVVVATNQDVPAAPADTLLTLDHSSLEVSSAAA